jgi:hypothetical protein
MPDDTPASIDEGLLRATIKLNTALFAAVCGFIAGMTLLFATYVSLLRGLPNPGYYLSLLGVFLPGYSVSPEGAWIGLLWGALLGGILGALMYRVYARGIRKQVVDYLAGNAAREDIHHAILKLHGHSLGIALGTVAAAGLLATTNWLVARGTAEESVHAALLSQYLPGYAVSTTGSFIGAAEVFVVAYLSCLLLAAIHNRVVAWRQKAKAA